MAFLIAAAIWGFILLVAISLCMAAKAGDNARGIGDRELECERATDGGPSGTDSGYTYTSRRDAEPPGPWTLGTEAFSGLLQALHTRDPRTGRHATAVAHFARDIARSAGMSDFYSELAYTAGLVHDIGHVALSDRVHQPDATLTDDDWITIWRHPEIGAKLLEDLGAPEPLVEIVLTHHERVDGRGYPRGLSREEIPEIAKIVAVAEVYDTLTAGDTYRPVMSSVEALRELRHVAESQLAGRYVEGLAAELRGREYRPGDAAEPTST